MPHFTPYDTLLLASDREARDGEICVVMYYGKLFIVRKSIKYVDGRKESNYVGLIDPHFKVSENEITSNIGYVVEVYNN